MSRNGSGTYSLPAGNPVVTGTTISSTDFNNTMTDIATALTQSIAKDGQTTPTANIPMGTYKITGLGAGTAATDAAQLAQVQSGVAALLGGVAGTNTITATGSPTLTAYASGQTFRFIPAATNTGATTINIDSLGAKNIYYRGAALGGGEIRQNVPAVVIYDGTQFNLVDSNGVYPTVISVGGAAPATSGAGITFPDTQSASSNANTLDDYEEGSFSVSDGSGAGLSIGTTAAYYVKIGRLVWVTAYINYPVTASGASAGVTGLPFTATGSNMYAELSIRVISGPSISKTPVAQVNAGTTGVDFYYGESAYTNANLSNLALIFTGCYLASA